MAREERKIQLRPVDDVVPVPVDVVRLGKPEGSPARKPSEPAGGPARETPHRLDVPAREAVKERTHQPGIEALIEPAGPATATPETAWGGAATRQKHVPWGWFVLIAALLAGAAVWSLARTATSGRTAPGADPVRASLAREEADERDAALMVERIEAAVRRFFRADSIADLTEVVRQPERVRPLMERYYTTHPLRPHAILDGALLEPLTLGRNADFWMKSVQIDGLGPRNLLVDASDPDRPRVDWETFVCYQPVPWDEFVAERPENRPMDFRVFASPDHFYAHEFADSERYACYQLTALDSDRSIFGYVERDSPAAAELAEAVAENGGEPAPVILRLAIPAGMESRNGVTIARMLSPRWLYIDPPDPGA